MIRVTYKRGDETVQSDLVKKEDLLIPDCNDYICFDDKKEFLVTRRKFVYNKTKGEIRDITIDVI